MRNEVGTVPHVSVLREEVVRMLAPKDDGVYVDGTFGAGGHTEMILATAKCKVIALDRDARVRLYSDEIKRRFGERFHFIQSAFGAMDVRVRECGVPHVEGILLDVGVSSMQIDEAERGFSFSKDGPLDMRMSDHGQSAADFVNSADEQELADVIYRYGDERKSRRIARAIVAARAEAPLTRTKQLAEIIKSAVGKYNDSIHPATRSFQAIRIWVNDELGELTKGLEAAEALLAPNGRLAVITFHSGEDTLVKRFLQERSGKRDGVSRYQPAPVNDNREPTFRMVVKKAIEPSETEVKINPRARSAKLRVAERTDALPWSRQEAVAC